MAAALKELGAHPEDGQAIRILSGRFGPYIKHGATSANVPRGKEPTEITLEEAVALLAERVAKGGGKKPVKKAAREKAGRPEEGRAPEAGHADGQYGEGEKRKAPAKKKPAAKAKAAAE